MTESATATLTALTISARADRPKRRESAKTEKKKRLINEGK
jgi:hypothetical protein